MSEYQYYEFAALDRPLTEEQMRALRRISTRAEITSTRLSNVYHFGSFGGDERALMRDYFDAMVYVTNWATRQLMLRLPRRAIDVAAVRPYLVEDYFDIDETAEHVVLDFHSWEEDGDGWGEWEEGEVWMSLLTSVRGDLLHGDERPLYIGWLIGVQHHEVEDDAVEPPVPPGLADLPAGQARLVEFLRIDPDLVGAAAEASPAVKADAAGIADWIAALPAAEKDALLVEAAGGDRAAGIGAELRRRFRADMVARMPVAAGQSLPRRTVAELRGAVERVGKVRRAEEARRAEAERQRRAVEAAAAREARIAVLAGRGDRAWAETEQWIEGRTPQGYADAAQRLGDLRELAVRGGAEPAFQTRYLALRERHWRKRNFMQALEAEGLE